MSVASTLSTRALLSVSNSVTRFKISMLLMPRIDSSVFGKCWPMSPAPIAPSKASAIARDISHVERSAAKDPAFAHAMNHFLEQREIRVNRLPGLGEPNRDDGFSQVRAIAHMDGVAI